MQHSFVHNGERPWLCRYPPCARSVVGIGGFNTKSNCRRHEKRHEAKGETRSQTPSDGGVIDVADFTGSEVIQEWHV
jgi:hypothetical protein